MASQNTVTLEMDLKEEDLATGRSSPTETKFDVTIGHIEDVIMEEEFQNIQEQFMAKYYHEFEDTEENKFCYTDIHKDYTNLIEKFIADQLRRRMPDFSMEEFQKQLISRKEELEGEVFEMLLTFSDFLAFKEIMLDYRAEKEGRTIDLTGGLTVTSLGSVNPSACVGLQIEGITIKSPHSNGVLPQQCHGEPTHWGGPQSSDCGEAMMEGGDTPQSSMETSHGGSSLATHQGATPLLDRVEMEDAAMESPRLDQ